MDPIEAALMGQSSTQAPSADPIEAALMGRAPAMVSQHPAGQASAPTFGALADPQFYRDIAGNAGDMGKAFAHHAFNLLHGGAQLGENVVAGLAQRLAPDSGVSNSIANTAMADDAAMAAREKSYQSSVPNNAATYTGAALGEVAPFMLSGGLQAGMGKLADAGAEPFNYAASKIPALASALRVGGKIAGGAMQGGAISAAAPVTDGQYADQKAGQLEIGGAVGAAAPLAAKVAGGAWNAVKGLATPFTNPESIATTGARSLAQNDPQVLAATLRDAPQYVPGSFPTTAQAGATPELVQAEKTLSNDPSVKGLFVQREIDNNAARIAAVQGVAGTPQALAQAVADRKAATAPMIAKYLTNGNPVPAATVMQSLQSLQNSSLSTDPVVSSAIKGIVSNLQDRIDANGNIAPAMLDGIRQNVSSFISENSANGVVRTKQEAAFMPVKDAITAAIESANPGYQQYLQTFAAKSVPINTMQVGQQVSDALDNKAFDANGKPMLNFSGYRSALAKALKGSEYGIDPQAQATLEGVQNDLQRATISNSLRTPGSDTAFNLQAPGWLAGHVYGKDYSGPTMPLKLVGAVIGSGLVGSHNLLGTVAGGAMGYKGAEKLGGMAASRVNQAMADALLNPSKFSAHLQPTPINQSASAQLARFLMERSPQAAAYSDARQPVQVP